MSDLDLPRRPDQPERVRIRLWKGLAGLGAAIAVPQLSWLIPVISKDADPQLEIDEKVGEQVGEKRQLALPPHMPPEPIHSSTDTL